MNYISCIALAFLVPVVLSARDPRKPRQWKLRPRADLTSSIKIAKLMAHLKKGGQSGIDMDYFGGSGERMDRINKRSKDRRSQSESDSFYPPKNRVRLVYVSNPEVLEEYKKKLKKIRVERGSSSEESKKVGGLSYQDVLQFLIQVDARLREREGRPTDVLPILSPPKLNKILKNLRRYIDKGSDEGVKVKTRTRPREYDDTKEKDDYRGYTFSMIRDKSNSHNKEAYDSRSEEIRTVKKQSSVESSWKKSESRWSDKSSSEKSWQKTTRSKSPMLTDSIWKRDPESQSYKQKESWESGRYEKKTSPWDRNVNRFRPKANKGKVPNFISTPIPLSGRQGIYEDDK